MKQLFDPTALRHLLSRSVTGLRAALFSVFLSLISVCASAAEFAGTDLARSIVTIQVYQGKDLLRQGSGFVVQADRFNGYTITNASLLTGGETLTVKVPGSGAELIANVLRTDEQADYSLLKINGLNLPVIEFSATEPMSGEVVWSATKNDAAVGLSKGILRGGYKTAQVAVGVYQHTATLGNSLGSALLNECGQLIGLNFSSPAADGSVRAIDLTSLKQFLSQQNVNFTVSGEECVSEVAQAREKADMASAEAKRAQDEAAKAQQVARNLEAELKASQRSNNSLVRQTADARARAESAMEAAEAAQQKAEATLQELETKTAELRAETADLIARFEEERKASEERFQDLLNTQQEAAEERETILIGFAAALVVLVVIIMLVARFRGGGSPKSTAKRRDDPGETLLHRDDLAEYVLDGRDDDGIRYLLRISGDQMVDDTGVIIGRNPKDSPYIINHADVSRKHARMKVMKNRVFIEDLGSTNGTSVNGQSIDDKGLVSISNGDQIIIGSVVMKLRVMDG